MKQNSSLVTQGVSINNIIIIFRNIFQNDSFLIYSNHVI